MRIIAAAHDNRRSRSAHGQAQSSPPLAQHVRWLAASATARTNHVSDTRFKPRRLTPLRTSTPTRANLPSNARGSTRTGQPRRRCERTDRQTARDSAGSAGRPGPARRRSTPDTPAIGRTFGRTSSSWLDVRPGRATARSSYFLPVGRNNSQAPEVIAMRTMLSAMAPRLLPPPPGSMAVWMRSRAIPASTSAAA